MNEALQHDVPIPPPCPPRPSWGPYAQYERQKARLNRRRLTPQEYSQAIKKIVDRLGV